MFQPPRRAEESGETKSRFPYLTSLGGGGVEFLRTVIVAWSGCRMNTSVSSPPATPKPAGLTRFVSGVRPCGEFLRQFGEASVPHFTYADRILTKGRGDVGGGIQLPCGSAAVTAGGIKHYP